MPLHYTLRVSQVWALCLTVVRLSFVRWWRQRFSPWLNVAQNVCVYLAGWCAVHNYIVRLITMSAFATLQQAYRRKICFICILRFVCKFKIILLKKLYCKIKQLNKNFTQTVVYKKTATFMFLIISKCESILIILSLLHLQRNCGRSRNRTFYHLASNLLLHYLGKFKRWTTVQLYSKTVSLNVYKEC